MTAKYSKVVTLDVNGLLFTLSPVYPKMSQRDIGSLFGKTDGGDEKSELL